MLPGSDSIGSLSEPICAGRDQAIGRDGSVEGQELGSHNNEQLQIYYQDITVFDFGACKIHKLYFAVPGVYIYKIISKSLIIFM